LLEVLELLKPIISKAAFELTGDAAAALMAVGLLKLHDHEPVAASPADDDDIPSILDGERDESGFTLFDSRHGPVSVPSGKLRRYRLVMPELIRQLTSQFRIVPGTATSEIVTDHVWDLGSARFEERAPIHSLWFARRPLQSDVKGKLISALTSRPTQRVRVLLTSARASVAIGMQLPGTMVFAIEEILSTANSIAISAEFIHGRLTSTPPPSDGKAIRLSGDGRTLSILDDPPFQFRSTERVAAIGKLVRAYESGSWVRVDEITDLGSLRRFFGTAIWKRLSNRLKRGPAGWKFEV